MHAFFFDIDGTLAIGTQVPPSAEAALSRLRAQGDAVFICTGRPRAYAEGTFSRIADGFVCSNGRLAFRGDRRLVDRPLAPSQIDAAIRTLDACEAGYAFFGEWEGYYCGDPRYRPIAEGAFSPLHDGLDANRAHVFNFDVYFADAAHRERIVKALGETCIVNPHGPHPSADVTVSGFGKGDAVREVARSLGIAREDTYAFGDGINDISMLEAAGCGIAMGNAASELKEIADYVTTSIDNDGVARALTDLHLA